jgi:hypothetical protein
VENLVPTLTALYSSIDDLKHLKVAYSEIAIEETGVMRFQQMRLSTVR